MHRVVSLFKLALVAGLAFLTACSTSAPPQTASAPYYVASVKIDSSAKEAEVTAKYGGSIISFKPDAGFAILGFSKAEGELSTLDTSVNQGAFASPEVEAAGFSAWAGGFSAWAGGWSAWAGGSTIPQAPIENDAYWKQIQLYRAQAISRNYGAGVTVAVIDTGLDLGHSMFQGRLSSSSTWKDYIDGDNYPADVSGGNAYGHGTGAAGLILQVAPKAKIMPIRVLDKDGKGDLDDVVNAIDWAVSKGANIINLSLGSTAYSNALQVMSDYAGSQGVYIIASAGNNGQQNGTTYPARMTYWGNDKLLGIGSVQSNELLSNFSAYGEGMFISAPGEGIVSSYPGNKLARYTGTSFAAPLVTGAVALARSEAASSVDLNQFHKYLIDSVYSNSFGEKNMAAKGIQDYAFGYGILDVEALIRTLPGWTSPITSSELISNSGFENGSMSGWWANNSLSKVVSSGAYAGSKAVRMSGNDTGIVYNLSNLAPNTTYTLSVALRNDTAGAGNSLGVVNTDGSGIWKWSERTYYGISSITFTTGNSNSKQISIWRTGPGYTYVDNVSLKTW
ncbi:MAG: S8 family serine peptidase [Trueperaceae bacterium]|nr:S8 family serine peptidase [Trueperaceae bacterium]